MNGINEQYQLDVFPYDLSERDVMLYNACCEMADNKWNIRKTARELMIGKNQLWNFINNELRGISYELFCVIERLMKQNRENSKFKFGNSYGIK